jgi:hypothetical protein
MELVLHFMYVVAIKDTGSWSGDSPAELSMIGFWNLIVVWLKVRSVRNGEHCEYALISYILPAFDTLEVLSLMGSSGRNGPARKYGPMHG